MAAKIINNNAVECSINKLLNSLIILITYIKESINIQQYTEKKWYRKEDRHVMIEAVIKNTSKWACIRSMEVIVIAY